MGYILMGIIHLAVCTFFQMVSFELFKNMDIGEPHTKRDYIDCLAGIRIYD